MTNPSRPSSPAARNRRPLRYRLHRSIGAATGLVLIYLIATGLPLQFTDPLNLGGRFVENGALLDWYGIQPPPEAEQSADAVHIGDMLYWQSRPIGQVNGFQGAIRQDGLAIVAADSSLLLFPADDPAAMAPESVAIGARIQRIGLMGDEVIVDTSMGLKVMDAALLNPSAIDPAAGPITWAETARLTGERLAAYQQLARARILTVERLLQDLHSGRAFGTAGEWLINLATLAMSVLALTGLMIWWRIR